MSGRRHRARIAGAVLFESFARDGRYALRSLRNNAARGALWSENHGRPLSALGVRPALGRNFLASEDQPGHSQEIILSHGGRTTAGSGHARSRDLLITAEIAMAVVLTLGAGLLVKSFVRLTSVDPGFSRDHVSMALILLRRRQPGCGDQQERCREVLAASGSFGAARQF